MSDLPTSVLPRVLEVEPMDTEREVVEYDAMDHETPKAAFIERLRQLGAHGRMLDIATGPGHIPLQVCDAFDGVTVVGIDLAPKMLAVANRRLVDSPHRSRVEFVHGDAKRLPFDDASFDTVFSNTSLHHLPEPRPMLAEAWRVLNSGGGGILLIRDLYRPADEATLAKIVAEQTADSTGFQRQMFSDSLRAALTPGELLTLSREVGMTNVEVVIDTDRHMSLQSVI
jgi:ubiquinone/menaquinone biosynthesis C-methylase UbiE